MTHQFDEFTKSLAEESLPRRESLRRLGFVLAGAVLSPLGLGTAFAGKKARTHDPCKSFCNQCPKSRRSNCLTACRACGNDPTRLCTDCWSYACCNSGQSCCGTTCRNLGNDFDHCGACYNFCDAPAPFENGACIDGRCEYWCVEGAVVCDGVCSLLDRDSNNCGACGHVCPASTPACLNGVCSECPAGSTNCGGYCANLLWDTYNCGACGYACPGTPCVEGVCDFGVPPPE
jgi:hypothetical protein